MSNHLPPHTAYCVAPIHSLTHIYNNNPHCFYTAIAKILLKDCYRVFKKRRSNAISNVPLRKPYQVEFHLKDVFSRINIKGGSKYRSSDCIHSSH